MNKYVIIGAIIAFVVWTWKAYDLGVEACERAQDKAVLAQHAKEFEDLKVVIQKNAAAQTRVQNSVRVIRETIDDCFNKSSPGLVNDELHKAFNSQP